MIYAVIPDVDDRPNLYATAPLGDLLRENSQNGLSTKPSDDPPGVPILRISAATSRSDAIIDEYDYKYLQITETDAAKYQVMPGDLLACRYNGNLHYVGRFALYQGYSNAAQVYPDKLIRFRVDTTRVLPAFVRFMMNAPNVREAIESFCTTTAGNIGISAGDLKRVVIPIPPLLEQRRIVARIEELAARVERARGLRREAVQEVEATSTAVYTSIFDEGQLAGWPAVELGQVTDIRSGVTLGRKLSGDTVRVPYLRVANVQDGHLDLRVMKAIDVLADEVTKWRLQSGDILLTEGGDWDKLGRGAVWNDEIPLCIHQNHIFRVRPNPAEYDSAFLAALIGSPYGKRYFQAAAKQTTKLASINQSQLKAFKVFRPPLIEQQRIVAYLDGLQAKAGAIKRLQAESAAELDALLPALLARAFRGEL